MVRQSVLAVFLVVLGFSRLDGSDTASRAMEGEVLQRSVTLDGAMDIQKALREIAAQVGVTLVSSREVQGSLTLHLQGARLKDALRAVCSTARCEWVLSDGLTLVVFPPGPEQRMARMLEELRQLEKESGVEEEGPLRICTEGEDGRVEVLKVGGAANPTMMRTTNGIFRIWKRHGHEGE